MAWQKSGTPDTLSSPADIMTIPDIEDLRFNQFLRRILNSVAIDSKWRFNNNSGTVYSQRRATNGLTDVLGPSQTFIDFQQNETQNIFDVSYVFSISNNEKLFIGFAIGNGGVGAGLAPNRFELVAKFVPGPDADISRIDSINTSAGDYTTDSNISALGTN